MIAALNQPQQAGKLCRSFSAVTLGSVLAATPLAVVLFFLLVYLGNGVTPRDVPFYVVMMGFFSPFSAWIALSLVIHRRFFVFDEAADRLTIQGRLFFISCGRPRVFPISSIARVNVEEKESEGYSGRVLVEIEGKSLTVVEYNRRGPVWPVFQELRDIVDRCKRIEYAMHA